MECLRTFMEESYQSQLRAFAQSKSERYEECIENYKNIFLAHFNLIKKDCSNPCGDSKYCDYIRNMLCGIDENEVVYFFDELRDIYLDWIDAKTNDAIERFKGLLKKFELLEFKKDIKDYDVFFKGRVSEQVLTSWDMFHIPFNKRYLIKNQRFSLTGQPMLYVGSSVIDIAEEIELEDIKDLKISLVTIPEKVLNIFDLTSNINKDFVNIRLEDLIGNFEYKENNFFKRILSSICSFQKRQELKGFSFCEEYVLPQILAQILKSEGFDGIAYYSTKRYENVSFDKGDDDKANELDFRENIAIFTKIDREHVYDRSLYDKLEFRVPIDIEKVIKLSKDDIDEIKREINQSSDQNKTTSAENIISLFDRCYGKMLIDGEKYTDTEYGKIHMYELYTVLNEILVN